MQKRSIQRGRPTGTTTYEAEPARAFGVAVREARTVQGVAQETLAGLTGIERSHMGKIERGEHMRHRKVNSGASRPQYASPVNKQTDAGSIRFVVYSALFRKLSAVRSMCALPTTTSLRWPSTACIASITTWPSPKAKLCPTRPARGGGRLMCAGSKLCAALALWSARPRASGTLPS